LFVDSAFGDPPSSEQEVNAALSVITPRIRNPFLKRFMILQIPF